MDRLRHDYRTRGVGYLTKVAWRAAGGVGDPLEDLKLAFALNFSASATHALVPVRLWRRTQLLSAEISRTTL